MKFEVSAIDFEVLVSIYKLLDRGGRNVSLTRSTILQNSNISKQRLSSRIKSHYLLEKQLKENIP